MKKLVSGSNEEKSSNLYTIPNFSFSDLVDISDLQKLVKHYAELAGCVIGILDADNTILAVSGWQKICSCFHRVNPETKHFCEMSDSYIRKNLKTEKPIAYKCKNGLWDVAYPFFIEGKHLATIFFGQFFIEDEVIDISYFKEQANKFGFDKTAYLQSVTEIPVFSTKKIETLKHLNAVLAQMLTKMGYANLLLKKEKIEELGIANEQLKESEFKFRKLFEQAGVGVTQVEVPTGRFLKINKKFADMLGYSLDELLQMNFQQLTHPEDLKENLHQVNLLLEKKLTEFSTEKRYIRKDGRVIWVILTVSVMSEMADGTKNNIVIVQDITERKQAERILEIRETILKFSIHCNLDQLIRKSIDEIENLTESKIGFFHFLEKDQQTLWLQNWSTNTIKYMCTAEGKGLHYSIQNAGVWVDCVKEKKTVIHNNYNDLKHRKGLPEGHAPIIREMVVPIFRNEKIVGIIGVGNKLTNYDESQAKLVEDFADMVWEIVERKKAEQALLDSEFKFKTVFDRSPVGFVLFDIDGKLIDCNPACLSMVGIDEKKELLGVNLFEDPHITEQLKEEIKKGDNFKFEIIFNFDAAKKLNLPATKKSGISFFSCFSTIFNSEEHTKTGILIDMIDITDRKKEEEVLQEENERFHTSMNALDSVVYVADLETHKILFVNKYVSNLFGDIVGKKCYSALQGKTEPCDFCTNHLLIDAKGKANMPYIWEFKNLITGRWYQCHDQAIQWTDGKLVRFEMASDITVNKENEQTLKKNEIMLKELNATKDKFFSIIAHDLKNPFTVLKTGSELLSMYLEKNDLEKSKAKAVMLSNASRHGYALLENLLAWAKSQTGGIKFEPRKINFKHSVANNIREVEDHAIEKNISIKNEIPDDLVIYADGNLLSVVFRNLITNAIKFTHNAGTIIITAKVENGLVEVAVIDTGIGIPKEHQYKLFRIDANFSRVGTANEASTSLGLILCKEFIEKHKGRIWVESEANKGSEFRFTLPYNQ